MWGQKHHIEVLGAPLASSQKADLWRSLFLDAKTDLWKFPNPSQAQQPHSTLALPRNAAEENLDRTLGAATFRFWKVHWSRPISGKKTKIWTSTETVLSLLSFYPLRLLGNGQISERSQRAKNLGKQLHKVVFEFRSGFPSWTCMDLVLISTPDCANRTQGPLPSSQTDHWKVQRQDRSKQPLQK